MDMTEGQPGAICNGCWQRGCIYCGACGCPGQKHTCK